ncbi:MAG: hypothetical protein ACRD3K_00665, partial [Edaphobacter sp.]
MYPPTRLRLLGIAALASTLAFASTLRAQKSHSFDAAARQTTSAALEREVHADMNFFADDELHGRGSATRDEHIAALFVAAQLQS